VTTGYWNDPERTAEAFVVPPGEHDLFYRTGDRVERDADGDLYFIGRLDDQVKVRGHRIELGEVAHVLKDITQAAFAYVLAHPVRDGLAQGLVAVLPGAQAEQERSILAACAERLPDYMVPTTLHFTDDIPYNSSGKADLRALLERLDAGA
jgi:acyl-coenzyme A synthetase/AMP-(fatty) acid ligase